MVSRAATAAYLANVRRRKYRKANSTPPVVVPAGVAGDASQLGGTFGYIGPGLGALGVTPQGSLTPDATGGITIDSIFSGGGQTLIYNIGDDVAAIQAKTLYVNGAPLTFVSASYNEGANLTQAAWSTAPINALGQPFTVEFR